MSAKNVTKRKSKKAKTGPDEASEILKLVSTGVERFILYDAPIADFHKAIEVASRKGGGSSHPLSGSEFRRIVSAAMGERKRFLAKRRKTRTRKYKKEKPK